MIRRIRAGLILGFSVLAIAGITIPSVAAPANTRVDSVVMRPSGAEIGSGDPVAGEIDIRVHSESSIGLGEVRLDVRRGSDAWVCLKRWDANGSRSFNGTASWLTERWPGSRPTGCPASDVYGSVTRNGAYTLRVTATENTTGAKQDGTFALKIDNRPGRVEWSGSPEVEGETEREPVVTLRWQANEEPDVVEYRYVRVDPAGGDCETGCEYAVSASSPEGQGCELSGGVYTCIDDDFDPDRFDGRYSYTVTAYRSSAASSEGCALPPQGRCIGSPASTEQRVQMTEPPPPPTPTPSSSAPAVRETERSDGSSGSGRSNRRVLGRRYMENTLIEIPDTFETTLPYDSSRRLVPSFNPGEAGSRELASDGLASADDGQSARDRVMPIAAGLLFFLGAAHVARLLKQ